MSEINLTEPVFIYSAFRPLKKKKKKQFKRFKATEDLRYIFHNEMEKTFFQHFSQHHSGRKPSKIWVDQVSGLYNRSLTSWFHDNDIET